MTTAWKPARGLTVAGLALLLAIPAAVTAYYLAFQGVRPYDDEGTLMDMTRAFLAGQPLYDGVPSIYGPAFFLYQWAAHAAAGAPVTTDSIRFVTIAFWLATDLLVFWMVYRATRSWIPAAAAFVLAFEALKFLGEDPGHPQELCACLVLAIGVVACCRANLTVTMCWLGALAGVLALTKINIGIIMLVAVGFVLAHALPWRIARVAAFVTALAFVWLLMTPLLSMNWTRRYLAVEELSLAGLMVVLWPVRFDIRIQWRHLAFAAAGFVTAVGALTGLALATGSTTGGMIDWLIVKPRTAIGPAWYWELTILDWMLAWSVVCLFAAIASQSRWARPWMIAAAKLVWGAWMAVIVVRHRIPYMMTVVPPLLWLVTISEDKDARDRLSAFSRALLASVGVLLLVYAYPVAGGTQINLIATFLIGVTAIAAWDGARWMLAHVPVTRTGARWLAYAAAIFILSQFCVRKPLRAREEYLTAPALNLPGAHRIHLDDDAAGLRRVAEMARTRCNEVLTAPGMPSFNIWTGLPRPRALGGGNWVTGLDDATQENVVREIAGNRGLCVIYNRDMIAMWSHDADVTGRPVVRFINENFRPVGEGRGNVLMVRREQ